MKLILIIFALIIGLTGCSRNIDCTDPPVYLSFIAFSSSDIDTLVLRKFTKDNNFQSLLDTLQVTLRNGSIVRFGDTSSLSLGSSYNYPKPGFDWQIFIPATNRTVSITNIIKQDRTDKCAAMASNCFCNDKISSITVDNQNGALREYYYSYTLFIKR